MSDPKDDLRIGQLVWTDGGDEMLIREIISITEELIVVRLDDGLLYELEHDGDVWIANLMQVGEP